MRNFTLRDTPRTVRQSLSASLIGCPITVYCKVQYLKDVLAKKSIILAHLSNKYLTQKREIRRAKPKMKTGKKVNKGEHA